MGSIKQRLSVYHFTTVFPNLSSAHLPKANACLCLIFSLEIVFMYNSRKHVRWTRQFEFSSPHVNLSNSNILDPTLWLISLIFRIINFSLLNATPSLRCASFSLRPVQTLATLLANKTQHCWAQHVASVCTPCCVLLRVVATCWKLLDEVWNWSNFIQQLPTSRWPTMLRAFGRAFRNS